MMVLPHGATYLTNVISGFPFSTTYVASSAPLSLPMFVAVCGVPAGTNKASPAFTLSGDGEFTDALGSEQSEGKTVAQVGNSVPACSAAMYAAYQSGQFSSRCPPLRFSCWPCAASVRRKALAKSLTEPKDVTPESMRPDSRVVISCNSQLLPSGSLNVARER